MKSIKWDIEKNELLKTERNISFEDVVFHIGIGNLLDVIENSINPKYQNQKIFVLNINDYVYYVPFVETEEEIFLKTIIPSRKLTKKYLKGK